jgi:DNA-binding CsgD family transcriptional regulator
MKVTVHTKQAWKVSAWNLRHYNETELENTLKSFNHAGGSNFYLLDYYRKKIIVNSPSALILCGYSKAMADRQGFDFFQHILSDEEWDWLNKVNIECYEFFFNYPEHRRNDILISYDLKLITVKDKELVLHHHVVPYKLCQNGNVWLGLCHVWIAPKKKSDTPTIIDKKTGERYNFINDKFVKSDTLSLTQEELAILKLMVQELLDEEMSEVLGISSVANFKHKKRMLFKKLGAGTSVGAIHKAHFLGLI